MWKLYKKKYKTTQLGRLFSKQQMDQQGKENETFVFKIGVTSP